MHYMNWLVWDICGMPDKRSVWTIGACRLRWHRRHRSDTTPLICPSLNAHQMQPNSLSTHLIRSHFPPTIDRWAVQIHPRILVPSRPGDITNCPSVPFSKKSTLPRRLTFRQLTMRRSRQHTYVAWRRTCSAGIHAFTWCAYGMMLLLCWGDVYVVGLTLRKKGDGSN